MTKFPRPEDIPTPSISGRPGLVGPDRSGSIIAEGVAGLAEGASRVAGSLYQMGQKALKEQNIADIAAAEARYLQGSVDLENNFDQRNDWLNFENDAKTGYTKLKDEAAALIRDPKMRASWLAETESKNIIGIDRVGDKARSGIKADNQVKIETSLMVNARLVEDPTVSSDVRQQALIDMQGTLIRALDTATLTTEQVALYRDKYLDGAEENFQINSTKLEIMRDPEMVKTKLGIPTAMGGQEVGQAIVINSGGPVTLSPQLAVMASKVLGDTALPSDPDMRAAYLSDPETNTKYTMAAIDALTAKYGGDVTAAVITLAPGSSEQITQQWMRSKHDESVLPKGVKDFYRATMSAIKGPASINHISALAVPGVMIEEVDPALLDRWETLQSVFGQQLTITSGKRDPDKNEEVGGATQSTHLNGEGIDIDTSGLSDMDLIRLLQSASAMGFGGIGIEGDHVHLDLGPRRAWGPDHSAGSIPAEYADLVAQHMRGAINEIPGAIANVDPSMSKISFDNRMKLYAEAQQESDRKSIEKRAGIEIAAQNAPQAVFQTGEYDGYMPTAEDYVEAYGGAVGVERWKAFKLSMDVARDSYSMKTMSLTDIADMLEAKVPTSTGDMAAFEAERYSSLVQAAAAIKKSRDEDPATAALEAFPALKEGAKDFGTSSEASAAFLTSMAEAQNKLGIAKPELLPKTIVDPMMANYKDATKPMAERMQPLVETVFATSDPGQRRALVQQLIDAGIPAHFTAVMDTMERGDESGSQYLIRAMMVDPKDLPTDLGAKASEVTAAVNEVFSQGNIGQVRYGLSGAPTDQNLSRAIDDSVLFTKAVKLRLADGSAQNLEQAVALTTKDMWGDLKVSRMGGNAMVAGMSVAIPSSENPDTYQIGFTMLLPSVAEALNQSMTALIAGMPTSDGSLQLGTVLRDNEVTMQLRNGHFVNAGNGTYQFLDMDGFAVTDADNRPITFTDAEVKAAAAKWGENGGGMPRKTVPAGFGPDYGIMQSDAAYQRERELRKYLSE